MTTAEAYEAGYDDGQCDRYSRAIDLPDGVIRDAYRDGYDAGSGYGQDDRTFEIYEG